MECGLGVQPSSNSFADCCLKRPARRTYYQLATRIELASKVYETPVIAIILSEHIIQMEPVRGNAPRSQTYHACVLLLN